MMVSEEFHQGGDAKEEGDQVMSDEREGHFFG
jgi:hypothetical protein